LALCDPCREGRHGQHRGSDSRPIKRKGLVMKTREVKCSCVCVLKEDWRGIPQDAPKWERKVG